MAHEKFLDCIEACQACAVACRHCAAACLLEPDVKHMVGCIALDGDCAQVCAFAASLMSSGSDFVPQACRLCAQICEACADECAKHDHDHCRQCAQACRQCAQACAQHAAA